MSSYVKHTNGQDYFSRRHLNSAECEGEPVPNICPLQAQYASSTSPTSS